ncbi:MAG: arginine decarboxylase [Desulfurococcaceae archaeon]|uniref:arginine decarboxylase n=1 Tax=Staphylothermus marinus TaxID=2280 RepID=A0A7C4NPW2_STAMA
MTRDKPIDIDWTCELAKQLYNIDGELKRTFLDINDKGHLVLKINGDSIDLYDLAKRTGFPGFYIRVLSLIKSNMDRVYETFTEAMKKYNYRGALYPVFPLKVNSEKIVIDLIYNYGSKYGWGFNVTSSAEIDLISEYADREPRILVLDGFKTEKTIERLEKFRERGWKVIVDIENVYDAKLMDRFRDYDIGLRIKFMSRGKGPWKGSAGLDSKFGLSIYTLDKLLSKYDWIYDKAVMLHTHPGSQIYDLETIRKYLVESANLFRELKSYGLERMEYIDFGGGLPYPYHESRLETRIENMASPNYGLVEYVEEIMKALVNESKDHPNIIFEGGRFIVASHRIVISKVLTYKSYEIFVDEEPSNTRFEELRKINDLDTLEKWLKFMLDRLEYEMNNCTYSIVDRQELEFEYGLLEKAVTRKVRELLSNGEKIDDLLKKHKLLKDFMTKPTHRFYAVLSVFAHIPDKLIVNQYFQVIPLQRLNEKPDVLAVISDLTCDSMGEYGEFYTTVKNNSLPQVIFANVDNKIIAIKGRMLHLKGIPLHLPRENEDYYIAILDTGAYQDNLSMNHNSLGKFSEVIIDYENGKLDIRIVKNPQDRYID